MPIPVQDDPITVERRLEMLTSLLEAALEQVHELQQEVQD